MMPELWYNTPKVHRAVVRRITLRMDTKWTFSDILAEVLKEGITEDDDQILTTRTLVDVRDVMLASR